MGLKSVLQGLITAFVDGGNAPASQFRTQQTDLLNNGYVFGSDIQSSQAYTVKSGTSINYSFDIVKAFGMITITGEFQNMTSSNIANGTSVFAWRTLVDGDPNEFRCKATATIYRVKADHDISTLPSVFIRITDVGMILPQGATANAKYYFQITYPSFS